VLVVLGEVELAMPGVTAVEISVDVAPSLPPLAEPVAGRELH
jgi:hypothetical protein